MAIRLRLVEGSWLALCAARSIAQPGDVYLDDGQHAALSNKFSRDYNAMFDVGLPGVYDDALAVEREESNNSNRDEWDRTFAVYG